MSSNDPLQDVSLVWPEYRPTRLIDLPGLARLANVRRVFVKLEGERPLGNFKVLGGMLAGLGALARASGAATLREFFTRTERHDNLSRLICASDGNHGLAVAAAAHRVGAAALIFLPAGVSRQRVERIEAVGGEIVRVRGVYDDAVNAAKAAAARGHGLLVPDTSSDPNDRMVRNVMAGYGLIAQELRTQFGSEPRSGPTHLFVQAGVGGLAAAMAESLHGVMRRPGRVLVVEPESAACVARALEAGRAVRIDGSLESSADMLSCGIASASALAILQRHRAAPITAPEHALLCAPLELRAAGGPETTPSGSAGLAGLLHVAARPDLRAQYQLDADSSVLLLATEGSL